ncbi:MAG: MBL fold metallo-hydrolase [Bacillota bacterium]
MVSLAERLRFGSIEVIDGANGARFPFCNSILVGGRPAAIIDPGAGPAALEPLVEGVGVVLNTHYHFDHISANHLFPRAHLLINEVEAPDFRSRAGIAGRLGVSAAYGSDGVAQWLEDIRQSGERPPAVTPHARHEWWLSSGRVDGAYPYDREFDLGATTVVMVHTPGHTAGDCCPYFPREGLVYAGDYDLTGFGPWYAGADGDPAAMEASAGRLTELDAAHFVTGHQAGVLDRSEFLGRLTDYVAVIHRRDERYLELVREGRDFTGIVDAGVLYPARFHGDPWVAMWERLTAAKHLARLKAAGWAVPPVPPEFNQ